MRSNKQNNGYFPNDRPRPRAFVTPEQPRVAEPVRRDEGRRRRAEKPAPPRRKAGLLTYLAASLAVIVLVAAGLSYFDMSRSQQRLQALRDQRAAVRAQHEKDVGYYVQMRRVSGYEEHIRRYAQEFQVDPSFLSAVIARESHYDPQAQSGVGARGLMQVMEDTGDWIAGRLGIKDYRYDRLFEPELNIRFGAWYINYLSSQFEGDPVMVASAYHAGANNVKLWAMKHGADQKRIEISQIPMDNTRDYVEKVMNAYALFYEYDSGNFYTANAS